MTTKKSRIPVSISADLRIILEKFSAENEVSLSQSMLYYIKKGLEYSEDFYFGNLADELDEKIVKTENHKSFWSKIYQK